MGSYALFVAVGDINGDGIVDVAVTNSGGHSVSVLLGKGDGTFHAAQTFGAESAASPVAIGDFNGDDWPDLAVASRNSVTFLMNTTPSPKYITP